MYEIILGRQVKLTVFMLATHVKIYCENWQSGWLSSEFTWFHLVKNGKVESVHSFFYGKLGD